MGRPTVLLFDIDGTLLDCGGAGRRAMERAFEQICGRADAVANIAFGGMTDPAIIRMGLSYVGAEINEAAIERVMKAYLAALDEEVLRASKFRILPAVVETLDEVARRGHFVGLGTGNVRRGAELKLGQVGLWERFGFGGYACDAEARADVLRHGASRGLALAGGSARVVVIGDTPHDIAAARAIDAECLAVATGRCPIEDLEAAGPTLAVLNLGDARVIDLLA